MLNRRVHRGRLSQLAVGVCGTLTLGLIPAFGLPASAAETSAAQVQAPVDLPLPAPTGPDRIGTVSLHLVDPTRRDPWVPTHPPRELMISIWYPAMHSAEYPLAPYMPAAAGAQFLADNGVPPGTAILPMTNAHLAAPVDDHHGARPVLLYSPGFQADRSIDTALVEDLASRGYVVVTIDHTHDAAEVQFPGGRVETSTLPSDADAEVLAEDVAVREADTRFVLNELTAIDHGVDPDVDHASLPRGITGALNLSEIGMFGWSLGGATAAATMHDDPRILAGADLDGTLFGSVVDSGLDRPFLLFSSQDHDRGDDASWASFWARQQGSKLDLKLLGAEHTSFTDVETFLPALAPALGLPPDQLAQAIGTIDPNRAISIERVYLAAFFDRELRHRHSRLLDGPSPAAPEVQFEP